jgi:diacylglycerol kinase family enzyme
VCRELFMLVSPSYYSTNDLKTLPLDGPRNQATRRTAVVLNANAKRVTAAVRRSFQEIVPAQDFYFSSSLDQADLIADTIIARRYDTVLAGGGDGTIVNIMNSLIAASDRASVGMYRPSLPDIGILRLGTGNGLAYATNAGRPLDDTRTVLAGRGPRARPLQLMEDAETRTIFPFASVGYDAQLLNDYVQVCQLSGGNVVSEKLMKTVAGYFFALGTRTIPQQLLNTTPQLRVVAEGRCSRIDPDTDEEIPLDAGSTLFEGVARCVAMGTIPYYGYKMKVFPFADRRSDRFHLRVSTASISYVLSHLPAVWNGSLRSDKFMDFLVEGVHIESQEELPYQVGGDAAGYRKEVDIRLSERSFRVLDGDRR